uniref:Uncharacterized protein n=1 Tax=Anguilla anguilla TaxID=7936 RepID=A0A0E9S507_ANGAN
MHDVRVLLHAPTLHCLPRPTRSESAYCCI